MSIRNVCPGLLAFLLSGLAALAVPPKAEIEALLGFLQGLDRAVFIRNGSEHTAAEAAAHLRMKWEKQSGKIKSAEDFIALCGSKSSLSGKRYQIRFKDGQVRYSDEVLAKHLVEIRRQSSQSSRATARPSPLQMALIFPKDSFILRPETAPHRQGARTGSRA